MTSTLHQPDSTDCDAALTRIRLRLIDGNLPYPTTCGVPLPQGLVTSTGTWFVQDAAGKHISCQAKVLASWPDGSAKWVQVVLPTLSHSQVSGDGLFLQWRPDIACDSESASDFDLDVVQHSVGNVTVESGGVRFLMCQRDDRFLHIVGNQESGPRTETTCRLVVRDAKSRIRTVHIRSFEILESGPLRAVVSFVGVLSRGVGLRFHGELSFFANSPQLRIEVTAKNPRRARHKGGYWDLGDPASIFVEDFSLEIATNAPPDRTVHWQETPSEESRETAERYFEIYQDSSGGENWRSRNHVNRERRIPLSFRGYRVKVGEREGRGERATPVVALSWGQRVVACTLEEFWQKFPSAVEVSGSRLAVRFWPRQFSDLHELQGGEHNTRVVWLDFARDAAKACQRLSSVHERALAIVDSQWIARSRVLPFFPSPGAPKRTELRDLLQKALGGPHSFFAKREAIDEYGWRNFGDVWADHEEEFYEGPRPIISHFNNQYDLLYSFLLQYLLTSDRRWWMLADPLARHLMDIDIYHATTDKSQYCGGLFWHTAHYLDAATCTHRSQSREMRKFSRTAGGGGPGTEHDYSSGLLLYYYLTGNRWARESVVSLAEWVCAMDDGRLHPFGVLCDAPTGCATTTGGGGLQDLGRGAGNSINTLLDGWLASGDSKYVDTAEEFIRRVVHPHDDVASRQLNVAEHRWSYTVFLCSLIRYVRETLGAPSREPMGRYVLSCLFRYTDWMVEHESPYLDRPDELEFFTATWPAQELRKATVLVGVSEFAPVDQRDRFVDKAHEILSWAWSGLLTFDRRYDTRPMALVLQQAHIEEYSKSVELKCPPLRIDMTERCEDFGPQEMFISQRDRIKASIRSPLSLFALVAGSTIRISSWCNVLRRSWAADVLRESSSNRDHEEASS